MIKHCICGLALSLGLSMPAWSALVSVSDSQDITASGQSFTFTFNGLAASDGGGGTLRFLARGDYTNPGIETASLTLDIAGGSLSIDENGVISNTVAGLTLATNATLPGGGGTDQTLDFSFDLSSALLSSILADSSVTILVNNSTVVNNSTDFADFVSVALTYNTPAAGVPVPGTLGLLAAAGLALPIVRRRRR